MVQFAIRQTLSVQERIKINNYTSQEKQNNKKRWLLMIKHDYLFSIVFLQIIYLVILIINL